MLEVIETRAAARVIVFNGRKYYRHQRKGYYFTSGSYPGSERVLHRAMWVYYKGPIPEGCEIHHKDRNRENNVLDNFECVSKQGHTDKHRVKAKPMNEQEQGTRIATKMDRATREMVLKEFRGRSTRNPIAVGRVPQPQYWRELQEESRRLFGRDFMDLNREQVTAVRKTVGRRYLVPVLPQPK